MRRSLLAAFRRRHQIQRHQACQCRDFAHSSYTTDRLATTAAITASARALPASSSRNSVDESSSRYRPPPTPWPSGIPMAPRRPRRYQSSRSGAHDDFPRQSPYPRNWAVGDAGDYGYVRLLLGIGPGSRVAPPTLASAVYSVFRCY